jgi:NifB/MoaA-like Fe-S oxidoreductase
MDGLMKNFYEACPKISISHLLDILTDAISVVGCEMKDIYKEEEFDIPDGVSVNIKSRLVTVEGPRGKLTKSLRHIDMEIKKVGEKKIKLVVWHGARKHVACLRTVRSLITNMINGVTKVSNFITLSNL